jgi:hypothetical protein
LGLNPIEDGGRPDQPNSRDVLEAPDDEPCFRGDDSHMK